jgi:hypothetical protein
MARGGKVNRVVTATPWRTEAMESSLKPRHVLRPQERPRSLCAIDAPVTGYKRKISVHAEVPLSGELTRKHFVEGCERFCLFLEEPPKSMLEHSVRRFALAGEPRVAHRTMQFLLIVGQMFPFNNG